MNEHKPWIDEAGGNIPLENLRELAKTWAAGTWEEFLKSTVESPMMECLSEPTTLESLENRHREDYQELLGHADYPNLQHLVGALVRTLSIREYEVVRATFWEGKSQHDIAKDLKITRSAVRNYKDRSLKKLGILLVKKLLSSNGLKVTNDDPCPQVSAQKPIGRRKVAS